MHVSVITKQYCPYTSYRVNKKTFINDVSVIYMYHDRLEIKAKA